MSTYTVHAKRWKHGWELHIDGVGVTQSRNLDGAEQMVRERVAAFLIVRHSACSLVVPGFRSS